MTAATVGYADLLRDWADDYPPSSDVLELAESGATDAAGRRYWLELSAAWMGITTNEYRRRFVEPARSAYLDSKRVVYFVSTKVHSEPGDLIKIGIASDIRARMAQLCSQSPLPLFLLGTERGGVERERELHDLFGDSRQHGEWFAATDALLAYIRRLS